MSGGDAEQASGRIRDTAGLGLVCLERICRFRHETSAPCGTALSLNTSLTSGDEDEGGASVDDTSSRRQDGVATVCDRLVNTPEVGRRRGRREWDIVHRAGDGRAVIAPKGKLSGARLGDRDVVDTEYLLRYRALRKEVVRYGRDCFRVTDRTSSQDNRANTKDSIIAGFGYTGG